MRSSMRRGTHMALTMPVRMTLSRVPNSRLLSRSAISTASPSMAARPAMPMLGEDASSSRPISRATFTSSVRPSAARSSTKPRCASSTSSTVSSMAARRRSRSKFDAMTWLTLFSAARRR